MRRAALPGRRVVRRTVRRTAIIVTIGGVRKAREYSEDGKTYKDYPIQNENGHEYYINEEDAKCEI